MVSEALIDALADMLAKVEAETLGNTLAELRNEALPYDLANTVAEVEDRTLYETLINVKAETPAEALNNALAKDGGRDTWCQTKRCESQGTVERADRHRSSDCGRIVLAAVGDVEVKAPVNMLHHSLAEVEAEKRWQTT